MGTSADFRRFFDVCGWLAVVTAVGMALAVVAFFAFPPVGLDDGGETVLTMLSDDPWGGFLRLDPAVLILNFIQFPIIVGLFVALRSTSPSGAWTALAIGAPTTVAILVSRPILELYQLADEFETAATPEAQEEVTAAAVALLAQFEGTGWAIATGGIPLSFLISFVIMRRNPAFNPWTARLGIATSAGSLPFFVPVIGPLLLLFAGTIAGIATIALLARDFFRLGRADS